MVAVLYRSTILLPAGYEATNLEATGYKGYKATNKESTKAIRILGYKQRTYKATYLLSTKNIPHQPGGPQGAGRYQPISKSAPY